MKKILALLLAIVTMLSIFACGETKSRRDDDNNDEIEELEEKNKELEEKLKELEGKISGTTPSEAETTKAQIAATAALPQTTLEIIPEEPDPFDTFGDISGDFNILVSGNYAACNDLDSSDYNDLYDPTVVDKAVYERNELLKYT